MKTTEIIEKTIAENAHLIQNLFRLIPRNKPQFQNTPPTNPRSIPLITAIQSPAKVCTRKIQRPYNPSVDGVVFECLGSSLAGLSNVLQCPTISLFCPSIVQAAQQKVQQQYRLKEGDPCYNFLVEQYAGRIAVLTHLFQTALWIIDEAYSSKALHQPVDTQRCDAHECYRNNLAHWFVARIVRHKEELRSIMLERIYSDVEMRRIHEVLCSSESNTLEAFSICLAWKSSSLEMLMALCHAGCSEEESSFRRNPHGFWWELSIQLFDHRLSPFAKSELRRIITLHFSSLRAKLPFAFLDGQFHLRN
jgi:hypothetical protein